MSFELEKRLLGDFPHKTYSSFEAYSLAVKRFFKKRGFQVQKAIYDSSGDCIYCGECGRCPGVHIKQPIRWK